LELSTRFEKVKTVRGSSFALANMPRAETKGTVKRVAAAIIVAPQIDQSPESPADRSYAALGAKIRQSSRESGPFGSIWASMA